MSLAPSNTWDMSNSRTAPQEPTWRRRRRLWSAAAVGVVAVGVPGTLAACSGIAVPRGFWKYGSIPVVSGLLNWATNRLAILMMFYPIKFRGIVIERMPFGWQGIVPNKALSMANRIVDDVMLRLIDVKTIFARLCVSKQSPAFLPPCRHLASTH